MTGYKIKQVIFVLVVAVFMASVLSVPAFFGAGWGFPVIGFILGSAYGIFLLWLLYI